MGKIGFEGQFSIAHFPFCHLPYFAFKFASALLVYFQVFFQFVFGHYLQTFELSLSLFSDLFLRASEYDTARACCFAF